MAAASIPVSETPLVLYTLRRADDALILGHRLSEWCGHAPMLEEDMALANMALDLIGQARALYAYAAKVEGRGNDEDKFAYLRDVRQYRNLLLVEQPNGDFARTIVRQFFYSAFADLWWRAMMGSTDARWRRSRRRRKRKAPTICAIPRNGSSASATAPRKAMPARRPRSTISGPSPARCSRPTTASAAWSTPASRSIPPALRRNG